jgi:hypothetical protein
MSRRPARFTQADLDRALRAAEKAGPDVAVDILPDGTIRLTRVAKNDPAPSPTERRLVF